MPLPTSFVSKLGPDSVATVGITESLITIVYSIAFGISMATTSIVSRRIGEKQPDKAARTAFQSIITGIFASTLIAIPGIIFGPRLLELMGANENIVSLVRLYPHNAGQQLCHYASVYNECCSQELR
ncbi:MAG: MATE family efflux transporter [Bacteroidales bacterium]